jgi:hypothetical protein
MVTYVKWQQPLGIFVNFSLEAVSFNALHVKQRGKFPSFGNKKASKQDIF